MDFWKFILCLVGSGFLCIGAIMLGWGRWTMILLAPLYIARQVTKNWTNVSWGIFWSLIGGLVLLCGIMK